MATPLHSEPAKRYHIVSKEKADGATYTPKILADFVAQKIIQVAGEPPTNRRLRILDPAIGHGQLLISLLEGLTLQANLTLEVYGFETDQNAIDIAANRIKQRFPNVLVRFENRNFLEFILTYYCYSSQHSLFQLDVPMAYDLIIANPPYVRTQIMGATQAQLLAKEFRLSGRVDLYHAFILGITQVLDPKGVAGIIVSNRFMTTRAGASVRQALLKHFNIRHAWDLGDSKLFDAAVLPAVLLVEGKGSCKHEAPNFTSIYQTTEFAHRFAPDPISALGQEGVIGIKDGRCFKVQHGKLNTSGTSDGVWRLSTEAVDSWLSTVENHSWGTFRDIGKVRVGVKTCADKTFIRNDWQDMLEADRPELLRPITTHHVARRFKPLTAQTPLQILYPHEVWQGRRRAINLEKYPRSKAYLTTHRALLEKRQYVKKSGRKWYELWVPQDPDAWNCAKLVFRDIAAKPTFWIDLNESVVNGDCYWLICQKSTQTDLLWLAAAVGNSSFIERFYDHRFNNKLYANRRRFITQYVEKFPLPDPQTPLSKKIISKAKQIYECVPYDESAQLQQELDSMIWKSFGLDVKKVAR